MVLFCYGVFRNVSGIGPVLIVVSHHKQIIVLKQMIMAYISIE